MYAYNDIFYRYIEKGSISSAKAIIPVVYKLLQPDSVLDVGCGRGAWLSEWKAQGINVSGIDGDYVDQDNILIKKDEFHPFDLTKSFDLKRKFSLVECLEVAEHIPRHFAEILISSLCKHSDLILFSAAPPGQGGENHVNEQPYEYWRKLFHAHGFSAADPFRESIISNSKIEPWYRYNLLLFVRADTLNTNHAHLKSYLIPEGQRIPDVAPHLYKVRRKIVSILPTFAKTLIAKAKKHFVVLKLKNQQA